MRNPRGSGRRGRVAAWIVVAIAASAAFAALGGVGLAQNGIGHQQSQVGLQQFQYGKKVTVCHKGKKSIRISVRGWLGHKRHGDAMGTCEVSKRHGKHGKHRKKDKGARSDSAKTLTSGDDDSQGDASESDSDTKLGERGAKGKGESRGYGKGGNKN